MITQNRSAFNDVRASLRIKENKRILWRTSDKTKEGYGRIRNISTTGMLMETNTDFKPYDYTTFTFDSFLGHNNFIPQNGRLIWYRQKNVGQNRYLCGIKFIQPGDFVLSKLRQRIQQGAKQLAQKKRLVAVSGGFVLIATVLLTGFVVWQSQQIYRNMQVTNAVLSENVSQQAMLTQSYKFRYEASQLRVQSLTEELAAIKELYIQSDTMLTSVNQELEITQYVLRETENMLSELEAKQTANNTPPAQITGLDRQQLEKTRTELEGTVALLQERNAALNEELKNIQEQLAFYDGDVQNIEEGRALADLYQKRLKEVKQKIRHFKTQAEKMRIAAMKERDRIQMVLGNNGYFVKDGKVVTVDTAKYNAADSSAAPNNAAREVKIDVKIVD
ncbi:MAG: PilZ domain-containing protein [Candidatus Omnitrophica bacterium]|nr:PilZ domain-containing protein [Candidatus Omnitrophota bacterium]